LVYFYFKKFRILFEKKKYTISLINSEIKIIKTIKNERKTKKIIKKRICD